MSIELISISAGVRGDPIRARLAKMKILVKVILFTAVTMPLLAEPKLTFSAQTSQGSYGEVRVRGKASITVKDLNWVRYQYKIRRQVTAVAAPDVLKILPFLTTSVASPPSTEVSYRSLAAAASQAENAQRATEELVRDLRAFIAASEGFPAQALTERSKELLDEIKTPERKWPSAADLKKIAPDDVTLKLIKKAEPEWRRAEDQIAKIAAHLHAAAAAKTEISESITCGFRPRKEELTLLVFDLFPPNEADEKETEAARAEELPVVTFVCEHPLSFSTGVFISTLDEKEFDFRPMVGGKEENPTATDVIGFNNRSSFRMMPGVMVNMLVWQPSYGFDVRLSFGALADFGGKQGTALEFIVGPSFGIKKSALFTVGAHVGRVLDLQGGFKIGTPKIEGLDSVPTQKSYRVGLGFGISYSFTRE